MKLIIQIMIYSEPERKGRLLALWQSMYQLATTVGGAINLALNIVSASLVLAISRMTVLRPAVPPASDPLCACRSTDRHRATYGHVTAAAFVCLV